MATVRVDRCPDCKAMVGEGMLYEHQQRHCTARPRPAPPTAEAIAQAVALLEETCQVWESHQPLSPGGKASHEAAAALRLHAAALRLLLLLAADYVPAQDREQALDLAASSASRGPGEGLVSVPDEAEADRAESAREWAEARRLLKLPARGSGQ